jgi:transposase
MGTKNKFTKGGSSYIRRALYLAATVAIRKHSKGAQNLKGHDLLKTIDLFLLQN